MVETQQAILSPDKINLASLGNVVPHLHWHVIALARRPPFPDPIWAPARVAKGAEPAELKARLARTRGAAAALPRPPGRGHERCSGIEPGVASARRYAAVPRRSLSQRW